MKKISNSKSLFMQLLALYFVVLFSFNVQAQNNWITLPNGETLTSDNDGPIIYYYENRNGEEKIRKLEDLKEDVKIIITLKDKPLALYKSKDALPKISLASVSSSLKQVHSTVISKIENIGVRLSTGKDIQSNYKVNHEYYTAINGIAMECSREMIQYIRELPEVKNVHLDRR